MDMSHSLDALSQDEKAKYREFNLHEDIFKLMSNQLISTTINLMQDIDYKRIAKESKGDEDLDEVNNFSTALCNFGMLINRKNGDNILVKRWTKRIIIDNKYTLKPLEEYLDFDKDTAGIRESLLNKINTKVVEGIDDL